MKSETYGKQMEIDRKKPLKRNKYTVYIIFVS